MTVAIDKRCLVRIWNPKRFFLINQRRVEEGQRPLDVVKTLLSESRFSEAVATADWADGSRWSGFVYLDRRHAIGVIHHDEVKKLLEWPEFDNRGPEGCPGSGVVA
ncbi:hypothetical protein LAUMK4_05871 [Mycobacterium persicum]|uniref:CBS domain-containing protein n=1 Tax=Mycobacterium persicum TaxID=1487726 RepID=A0ABY6RSK5_9MYCO|nr:hypothetical protein [Mycobacterium persicum]ORB93982.1 hypothetical protein B1T44_04935 [Mycobacterium persicum]VAZ77510.1 hypothetical protein LAUMK15_03876 [Mycobacterium persicum]VBA33092.1 hypothetical protein LAUMK4_05871 [Mycobacterium persicum]